MAGLPGPGDRIEARCTRCNDITRHVIVALVGGDIVKVECRACGSVHKYYPPATPKEAKGKTAVCRVKAGETRKEAVNSFKPTSTPSTAAASPAAVSRAAAKAQKAAEDMEQNWQRPLNMTAASAPTSPGAPARRRRPPAPPGPTRRRRRRSPRRWCAAA